MDTMRYPVFLLAALSTTSCLVVNSSHQGDRFFYQRGGTWDVDYLEMQRWEGEVYLGDKDILIDEVVEEDASVLFFDSAESEPIPGAGYEDHEGTWTLSDDSVTPFHWDGDGDDDSIIGLLVTPHADAYMMYPTDALTYEWRAEIADPDSAQITSSFQIVDTKHMVYVTMDISRR